MYYYFLSKKEVEQESQHNHPFGSHNATESKTKVVTFYMLQSRVHLSCLCGSCKIAPQHLAKTHIICGDKAHTTETAEIAGGTAAAADAAARALRASRPRGLVVSQLPPDFVGRKKKEAFMVFLP